MQLPAHDCFSELAPYYDALMEHVDYGRWFDITTTLAQLLPKPCRHVDAACGTSLLAAKMRAAGWNSVGFDLSAAMLRSSQKLRPEVPLAQADLRALPFSGSVHLCTCLFDSLNFILDADGLRQAFKELAASLADGGLLYFDCVTERMVLDYYDGQSWEESNGHLRSNWESYYDRGRKINEARVRMNNGASANILECIYDRATMSEAVCGAGLELLGVFDAHGWRVPGKRTVRLDFVAMKKPGPQVQRQFQQLSKELQGRM